MDIGDAVTICLVLLALWTFIPRSFRSALRGGLEPSVVALARAVELATRAAAHVLIELAYKVLIGQVPPASPPRSIASKIDYVAPVPAPEPVRELAAPPVREAVLPHVHQVEPSEPAENKPASEPNELTVNAHLSRPDLIALLAVQKNDDGSYRFSSNQITGFVGGTAAEVKKQIADIREKPAPVAPPAPDASARGKSLRRPAEGW